MDIKEEIKTVEAEVVGEVKKVEEVVVSEAEKIKAAILLQKENFQKQLAQVKANMTKLQQDFEVQKNLGMKLEGALESVELLLKSLIK
jgi:hypothetical protein